MAHPILISPFSSCLGVDEAGRGPVLGPMVYGIAFCALEKAAALKELGCADSKQLTEEKRETIFGDMNQQEYARTAMGWAVHAISPDTISRSMFRRVKHSLNEVSMDSAIGLIRRAQELGVNIAEVYVDTVGPPEKYQEKLSRIFPDYLITVAKKADSTYPVVSAASIAAKVTRDHALAWEFPENAALTGTAFGSGYPGDPVTKAFLSDHIEPVFGYPRIVRFSWSTAEKALENRAVDMIFDEDGEDDAENKPPAITSFFRGKDKKGDLKRLRAQFFKIRCLENVVDL